MDETSRAWAILRIAPGSSGKAIKAAYREQVKAWHPDRFQGDADRLDEAHEMLKEINWAYDFLSSRIQEEPAAAEAPASPSDAPAAVDSVESEVSEDSPMADAPSEDVEVESPSVRRFPWILVVGSAVVILVVVVVLKGIGRRPVATVVPTPVTTSPTNAAAVSTPAELAEPTPAANPGLLQKMVRDERLKVSESPEGLVIKTDDMRDRLRSPRLMQPPFTFRATVKSDNADVRFYFGLGLVVLNWTDNRGELRYYDFATGAAAAAADKGALTPNEWHDLVFDVKSNSVVVAVDGETRYQANGNYQNLVAAPGLGPFNSELTVKSIFIEERGEPVAKPARQQAAVKDDLLATMIPVGVADARPGADGIIIYNKENREGYLQTAESYHTPVIIRTRVKTDSWNVRLRFGSSGMVIFNWEVNPLELRVHDPVKGNSFGGTGLGRITPNQWHDFVWELLPGGMRIFVDGQLRYQNRASYSKVQGAAGIGPYLSHLTVASFVVEQK